jgi:two-component system LytT family response regulator
VKKIRTLIVDDEPLARRTLRLLLEAEPGITITGEAGDGADAVRQILAKSPDLLFLDVQMPGMNGFRVLETVGADAVPAVVFVTAYDRYALQAFDAGAVDYLLKPFDDARFLRSLSRARASLGKRESADAARRLSALLESLDGTLLRRTQAGTGMHQGRLLVKSAGRMIILKEDEIDWIAAADYYVMIHAAKTKYLHREPLSGLVKKLNPAKFARIHRSTVVNIERVREIQPSEHGDFSVILRDGTRLRLARSRRHLLGEFF